VNHLVALNKREDTSIIEKSNNSIINHLDGDPIIKTRD